MSDHYLYNLHFTVRHDAPPQLHAALTKRADGAMPTREEVSDLPVLAQDYLCSDGGPGDGVYLYQYRGPHIKFRNGAMVEVPYEPHQGTHDLRMARTFHDDAYFNGGVFFVYWLFQFIAEDGPFGTMTQFNGKELPKVLTKIDGQIVETALSYTPARFWPMPGQDAPNAEQPVIVETTTSANLAETMESLQVFADGHSYD